jgi:DNA repair exonuclease SbcCD ATPase subunit
MSTRGAFLSSPHHAALALATLGLGAATGEPLFFIMGFVAYVLGWIYVPDLPLFQSWMQKRLGSEERSAAAKELADFGARRKKLLDSLTHSRRTRYHGLAAVCRDIENAATDGADDPRVRKLEELMWTFLRLLTIEESLGTFLETEARENISALLAEASPEVERLRAEVTGLRQQGSSSALDTRERLLNSRVERLEALRKRAERIEQAQANLALVVAEQERLEQQIKLIRADSIATRNASALSARIDATVEHLEHTNQWLAQMDEFRDVVNDLPQSGARVGFGEALVPPPLPNRRTTRGRERA